jgi:hypothetical protein
MQTTGDSRRRLFALPIALVLTLAACGGDEGVQSGGEPIAEAVPWIDVVYPLAPASPGMPHAQKVDDCVWSGQRASPCTLAHLPILFDEAGRGTPTVDQVMGRVVASHPWMAQRFRELLASMPPDMLRLFRPVTGVVLSRDVRPAFYWSYTGAIYLDPAYLWFTPAELADVSQAPDFRSGFGATLQFTMPWRYVKDNEYAYVSSPPAGQSRPFEHVQRILARLLFHELGHANDFLPPAVLPAVRNHASVYAAATYFQAQTVNSNLYASWPLNSSVMYTLGQIRFQGLSSSPSYDAMTPAEVSSHFAADGASDSYNYSTRAEDVAMLFEELTMLRHFGVDRDVAVTNRPTMENPTPADYVVAWGQRNRIGDPVVRERARYVAVRLLPESDLDAFAATLGSPRQMAAGQSWLDNLALGPNGPQTLSKAARASAAQPVETGPGLH